MSFTMENGNSLYARIAELEKENEELKKYIEINLAVQKCRWCKVGACECDCDKCEITGCYECVSGSKDGYMNLCDDCAAEEDDEESEESNQVFKDFTPAKPRLSSDALIAKIKWQLDEADVAEVKGTGKGGHITLSDLKDLIAASKKAWDEESDESEEDESDVVEWTEDRFGGDTCGFCNQPNDGRWIEGQEDAVCKKCSQVWEYDDDTDSYHKK